MIDIKRKEDCVGCNACVQICPKKCIAMQPDNQGFVYPKVEVSKCIECGLCEKVCPVINQDEPKRPIQVFAAWNENDEVRLKSSSGGIFLALAEKIIEEGGVVFGAKFNGEWVVIHGFCETLEGIKEFQGSKYVQSIIGNSYQDAERFLKSGRKVLFSGTPCQIAGLKRFLRKDYEGMLLTVDVVCHGVPSPTIWKDYLNYLTRPSAASKNTESLPYSISLNEIPSIEGISFRDKRSGWEKYGIAIRYADPKEGRNPESPSAKGRNEQESEIFETHSSNLFMQGFLKDLYLRPSCYECPAKCGKSHSDITLADFWGIRNKYPDLYSDKGVSLVLANTKNGIDSLTELSIKIIGVTYENALSGNPSIERSAIKPRIYESFWHRYEKENLAATQWAIFVLKPSYITKYYHKIRHIAGQIKRIIFGNKHSS